jgi:hypothetical protein
MNRDPNLELALSAFDRAIAKMRYIGANRLCVDEFRGHFPVVMVELKEATDYLHRWNLSLSSEIESLEK